jgi:hypothetical protein
LSVGFGILPYNVCNGYLSSDIVPLLRKCKEKTTTGGLEEMEDLLLVSETHENVV